MIWPSMPGRPPTTTIREASWVGAPPTISRVHARPCASMRVHARPCASMTFHAHPSARHLLCASFPGVYISGFGRTPLGVQLLQDERIFGTIVSWWLHRHPYVSHMAPQLVTASVVLYKQLCTGLMPTPAKSHYTFNLRDLRKVNQTNQSITTHQV